MQYKPLGSSGKLLAQLPNPRPAATIRDLIANSQLERKNTAKGAGIGYPVLFRWINEKRDIRGTTLNSLCQYFGMELREAGGKKKTA